MEMDMLCASFVKGVGKTTGVMLVVGVVAGLWALTTCSYSSKHLKKHMRSRGTDTRDTHVKPVDIVDVQLVDFKKVFEGL